MLLSAKLASLTREDMVPQLHVMLEHPDVSVNLFGNRLVSINGYEGSVEIDRIAWHYFRSNPFQEDSTCTLKERWDCYELWDKVKDLYAQSDQVLNKTPFFKSLVLLTEWRPWCRQCAGDPRGILEERHYPSKATLFRFPPTEFQAIWPSDQPIKLQIKDREKWMATREMVQAALKKSE